VPILVGRSIKAASATSTDWKRAKKQIIKHQNMPNFILSNSAE